MPTLGVLGSGRVGTSLARALAAAGHTVILGHRDHGEQPTLRTAGIAESIRRLDHRATISEAATIINATPGATTLQRLETFRDELAGKILIDVSNATHDGPDGLPTELVYTDGSLAERLQQALPTTAVVKTLNTMLFSVMTAPASLTIPPTVYLSGNDKAAKKAVAELLIDLDWQPGWIEDLGDITTARATEALILLVPHILRHHGFQPFAISLAR